MIESRVSGLLHVTGLPNDYYHFDPVSHRLTGGRGGKVFSLADSIRVRLLAVNSEDRKIDFALESSAPAAEQNSDGKAR